MTLSVIIITYNEEENIGRCLEQIKWADEIIVVDGYSQDKTVEIAKKYTDKIITHKWVSFFDQRSFALSLATCDFVLILDADEVLDEKGQDEIRKILLSKEDYDGYYIMNETYFLGRRLFFSQRPNPMIRLFKREKGFVIDKFGMRGHEHYGVHGHTRLINCTSRHYTANTIAEELKKMDRYSTLWAEEQAEDGVRQPILLKIVYVTLKSFIGNFFIRCGFLDGFPGFIWCVLKAMEQFFKYAKLYLLSQIVDLT